MYAFQCSLVTNLHRLNHHWTHSFLNPSLYVIHFCEIFRIYFHYCDFFVIRNNYFNGINMISINRVINHNYIVVLLTNPKITSMFRRSITLAPILIAITLSMSTLSETLPFFVFQNLVHSFFHCWTTIDIIFCYQYNFVTVNFIELCSKLCTNNT